MDDITTPKTDHAYRVDFDHVHFARTLRVAMARKGFTQADLADALELRTGHRPAQATISYWLRRDDKAQVPSLRVLPALLDALDLSGDDLFPPRAAPAPPAAGLPPLHAPLQPTPPARLVKVPLYALKQGRLRRTRRKMVFDAQMAGGVDEERLGGLIVPSAWDHMIAFVRPGNRLLLELYDPPLSLQQVFAAGTFLDGIYVVAFTTGLKLYRLQELPGSVVAALSDNPAYRQVELDLSAGDDLTLHARALASEGPP